MYAILVFALFVVTASAHNITLLEVPVYADPRRNVRLVCHYVIAKEDPPLHSVKWYRDEDEVFRYTPGGQPSILTFNMTTGSITSSDCDNERCSISVVLSAQYNVSIPFACEVSTERPRFALVKQTKTITIAVTLQQDPVITLLAHRVFLPQGEDVSLNCSTGLAMPPANIRWYINEKPAVCKPRDCSTYVLAANEEGLRKSWRPLWVKVSAPLRLLEVRCEAWQPVQPPYVRSTNFSLVVGSSSNLTMSTASGSRAAPLALLLMVAASALLVLIN